MRDESTLGDYPARLEQLKRRMIQVAERERVKTANMTDEERQRQREEDDRLLGECEEHWRGAEADRSREDASNIVLGSFVVVAVVGIALSVGYWICLGLAALAHGRLF